MIRASRCCQRLLPRPMTYAVSALAFLALASSCQSYRLDRIPGVVEDVHQDDVPIPRDFYQLDRGENWSYNAYSSGPGKFRSWVGEYVGYKQLRDLATWYERQMVLDGWVHKSTEEGDPRIITFVNSNSERARITLLRRFNQQEDRFQTVIRAEVGPQPPETMDLEEMLKRTGYPVYKPTTVDSGRSDPASQRSGSESDPARARVTPSSTSALTRQPKGAERINPAKEVPLELPTESDPGDDNVYGPPVPTDSDK